MDSTDPETREIEELLREAVSRQKTRLLRRPAAIVCGSLSRDQESCYVEPLVRALTRDAFAMPEFNNVDQLAEAMLRIWRQSGVEIDDDFARRLAALAFAVKSDEAFEDEPPAFTYTL